MELLIGSLVLAFAAALASSARSGRVATGDVDLPPSVVDSPLSALRHFSFDEFDSPDEPGSGFLMMDRKFLGRLDAVRQHIGYPLRINSGYRSKAHNTKVGGVADSSHMKGIAADIHCPTQKHMVNLVNVLHLKGFTRIGQYKTATGFFVHVDADQNKPQRGWISGFKIQN